MKQHGERRKQNDLVAWKPFQMPIIFSMEQEKNYARFYVQKNELHIQTDAGRVLRPLYIVSNHKDNNNKLLLELSEKLDAYETLLITGRT